MFFCRLNVVVSELLLNKTTFIKAKKGIPDFLFSSGECNKGVFTSRSQAAAEFLWFGTS